MAVSRHALLNLFHKDVVEGKQSAVNTKGLRCHQEQTKFLRIRCFIDFDIPMYCSNVWFYHPILDGPQYLPYETASDGSFKSTSTKEEGPKVLTFSRRLGIILGAAQATGQSVKRNQTKIHLRHLHLSLSSSVACWYMDCHRCAFCRMHRLEFHPHHRPDT